MDEWRWRIDRDERKDGWKEICMNKWIPGLDGWGLKDEYIIDGWMNESIPGLDWIDID